MQNFTFHNPVKIVARFAERESVFGENKDIDAKAVAKILKLGL